MVVDKNCGIYKITSPSGKIYIGQSKNIARRFNTYKNSLYRVKNQIILYNSFLKYGAENHQFDIIEYCSIEDLNCSERFWQDEFDATGKLGLNCILTECDVKCREVAKHSATRLCGENHPNFCKWGIHPNSKEVIDIVTKIRYKSIGEASYKLGIHQTKLNSCLKGKQDNDTTIRYAEDYDNGIERVWKKDPDKIDGRKRQVIDTVTLQVFPTLKEAAMFYNFNPITLSYWLGGKYTNNSNLTYVDAKSNRNLCESHTVKVKDISTGTVYVSMAAAARDLGIGVDSVRRRLKNKNSGLVKL